MITMTKEDAVKFVSEDWQIEALKAEGWVVEGEESVEEAPKRRGRPPKGE